MAPQIKPRTKNKVLEPDLCNHLQSLAAYMRKSRLEFWLNGESAELSVCCGLCTRVVSVQCYPPERE